MREIRLNWYEPRRCWRFRKKIGDKTRPFYVGKGATGPDDKRAKAAALLEAERLVREAGVEADRAAEEWSESLTLSGGMKAMADEAKEAAAFFRQPFKDVVQQLLSPDGHRPRLIERAFRADLRAKAAETEVERLSARVVELEALLSAQGRAAAKLAIAPLDELKEKYLVSEQAALRDAGRTSNHIGSLRTNLVPLIDHLSDEGITTTADLDANEQAWAEYRDEVMEDKQENQFSAAWLKNRLRVARLWAEWLVERGYLAKHPRSIGRHWSRAGSDAPSPTFVTIDECRSLFKAADDRLKLVIALGLNTGYRASDIRSLRLEHIDFSAKEIVRQRNKTGAAQRHKLWSITESLLREVCRGDTEPFEHGWSNIGKEIIVLMDTALPGNAEANRKVRRTGKSLRSTGAQVIEEVTGGTMPHVVSQWLAHGDKRLAKHYRREELKPLYTAIRRAEKAFGLSMEDHG